MDGKLRVAVYRRVGQDSIDQTSSYVLLNAHDQAFVKAHSNWRQVGSYIDAGNDRIAFHQMLQDCNAGKIDLIVTKSMGRFGDTLAECFQTIQQMLKHDPPIGIFFECENLNTLDDPEAYMSNETGSDPCLDLFLRLLT